MDSTDLGELEISEWLRTMEAQVATERDEAERERLLGVVRQLAETLLDEHRARKARPAFGPPAPRARGK